MKMVTGDHQLIGAETARQLGMGRNIYKIETLLKVRARGSGLGIMCKAYRPGGLGARVLLGLCRRL